MKRYTFTICPWISFFIRNSQTNKAPVSYRKPGLSSNKQKRQAVSLLLDKDVKSRGNRHKGKQRAGENACPYFLRSMSIILRVRRETAAENKRWRTRGKQVTRKNGETGETDGDMQRQPASPPDETSNLSSGGPLRAALPYLGAPLFCVY